MEVVGKEAIYGIGTRAPMYKIFINISHIGTYIHFVIYYDVIFTIMFSYKYVKIPVGRHLSKL